MNKIPNALPPTMITLGEQFGNASLTLEGARRIGSITCLTIGSKESNKRENTDRYPYHLIDLNDFTGRILIRSRDLKITRKQLRSLHREVTRKVAVFLFEHQARAIEC